MHGVPRTSVLKLARSRPAPISFKVRFAGSCSPVKSGKVQLLAGVPVDLRIEFKQVGGYSAVTFEWRSYSEPLAPVPASCLLHLQSISSRSHSQLAVHASSASAAHALLWGDGLSLATAGRQQSFMMLSRDAHNNSCNEMSPGLPRLHSSLRRANQQVKVSAASPVAGEQTWFYSTDIAQSANLHVLHLSSGTLEVQVSDMPLDSRYPANAGRMHPGSVPFRAVSTVAEFADAFKITPDLDWASSIRWTGQITAPRSELYTFYVDLPHPDAHLRVWLESSLIIDGSTKVDDSHFQGSIYLSDDLVYELVLAYSLSPETRSGLVLEWQSAALPRSAITSSSLLLGEHVAGSPFSVVVEPSDVCASVSTMEYGSLLTIATAGVAAHFTVQARDMHRNTRRVGGDTMLSTVTFSTAEQTRSSLFRDNGDGSYSQSLLWNNSGTNQLTAHVLHRNKIQATFFAGRTGLPLSAANRRANWRHAHQSSGFAHAANGWMSRCRSRQARPARKGDPLPQLSDRSEFPSSDSTRYASGRLRRQVEWSYRLSIFIGIHIPHSCRRRRARSLVGRKSDHHRRMGEHQPEWSESSESGTHGDCRARGNQLLPTAARLLA